MTLAILSATSAIIFQSLWSQMALVERVETATGLAIDERIAREAFAQVVAGLTPAWPEEEEYTFVGDEGQMSGLTATPLLTEDASLHYFTLKLNGPVRGLHYSGRGRSVQLTQFAADAKFQYLAQNGTWYDEWPSDVVVDPGPFDDSSEYPSPPVPRAVRIRFNDATTIDWIGKADWQASFLPRRQDLELGE